MYSTGVTSNEAVMSEGRTDSFTARRTVLMAEGVKGVVMASRESLVTWAFKADDEAERRARGFAS